MRGYIQTYTMRNNQVRLRGMSCVRKDYRTHMDVYQQIEIQIELACVKKSTLQRYHFIFL